MIICINPIPIIILNLLKKTNKYSLIRLLLYEQADQGLFCLHLLFPFEFFGSGP